MQKQEFEELSPYENFVYALKAKETKRQYPHRLDKFLTHLALKDDISTIDGWINNQELRRYTKEPHLSIDFGFNMLQKIKKFRKELIEDFSTI